MTDKLRANKRLKAGFVIYPPFVTRDPQSGKLGGYFIDLASEIARQGEFTIDYEEAKWGTMVAGLTSQRYDLVVSGVFPTLVRSYEVAFARPIMYVGLSGVVPTSDTRNWKVEDLRAPNLRIAVINGEVGHEWVRKFLPDVRPIVLDTADISRASAEVQYGRADIALTEGITCVQFSEANKQVRAVFVDNPLQVFGCTFMMRRGDPDWQNFINTGIDLAESSGVIQQLEQKYKIRHDAWLSRSLPWK
ncbi:MAG: amino acid ABC transporter substrate-binding protein [Planctomycetes bacterium]|nr:amino acid ABC transporter substrate-binding protein [Planctomycetota bacterium]